MRKIADIAENCIDCAMLDSLSAIKDAHDQLRFLTSQSATPALLASQIQLCDVLLDEISGIHTNLARNLGRARLTQQACCPASSEGMTRLN